MSVILFHSEQISRDSRTSKYYTVRRLLLGKKKIDLITSSGLSPAWELGHSAHLLNQSAQSARSVVVTFCPVSLPMGLYLVACGM